MEVVIVLYCSADEFWMACKGLDIIWVTFQWARKNKNMEFWQLRFKQLKTHTVEMAILGERILFTDDPENIKAILATQFGDYGTAFGYFPMLIVE